MLNKTVGGRYTVIRHLGGGGFGQTYLAEDQHLPGNPTCVVKQLKPRVTSPSAWQTARRLFDSEAKALYNLGSHNQIPRLFAHFEENQEFYLVQEFVAGSVLSDELKPDQLLPEMAVVDILLDILAVLEFVHQQQVVHRDIKPSNLMRRQPDRRIVLIDFGAVKQMEVDWDDADITVGNTVIVGSSGYMPNEQLAGKPGFSSDIYAVGLVGIQALTGVYPKRLREDPKTSEILWRDRVLVNPELANILDTMVRYDHRQRYQTATEVVTALRALYSGSTPVFAVEPRRPLQDGHLAWLERGDELFQVQRYREALAAYDKVIQARPDDYLAWFKQGIAHENLQQFELALSCYDRVVELQPGDYLAWFKRGAVLENLQQFAAALSCYNRVVEIQPDNYWAWHDQGKVLESLRQFESAVSAYDRAVHLKPNFQLAVESRRRLLSQLQQVDKLYNLQHYEEAIAACELAIQANPDDALAWLMKGMGLENLQHYEAAIVAYDRVVQIQPEDHLAWFKRGHVMQELERYEAAVTCYDRVVELQADNSWAWHDRGKALEALQHYEAAMLSYDRAMQLKGDFPAAIEARQRLLGRLQQGNGATEPEAVTAPLTGAEPKHQLAANYLANEADNTATDDREGVSMALQSQVVSLLQDLTQANVNEPQAWLQKGQALQKLQHYSEAIVAYNKAIQLNPRDPEVLRWRGNVLFTLGRYEEAIGSYDQAIQLQPSHPSLWCALASALVKLKRYREAIACFDRAIQLQPDRHSPWYWRGRLLWELKRPKEALHSYDQAIARNPAFQPALRDREKLRQEMALSSPPRPSPT
jgi:tetratricopeptide (TPR) repeat protein